MTPILSNAQSEDELDALVSISIMRAEFLDSAQSPEASNSWAEVMHYESRLASITTADSIAGGISRVGTVRAALNAGLYDQALRFGDQYSAENLLPEERRAALDQVFCEFEARLSSRYPSLVRIGRIRFVGSLKSDIKSSSCIFPAAA